MTNGQLCTLLAPALVSLFGVFFAVWRTDKRLDELRADMNRQFDDLLGDTKRQFDKCSATLVLIQQDLTRFHGVQSAHDEAIATLKGKLSNPAAPPRVVPPCIPQILPRRRVRFCGTNGTLSATHASSPSITIESTPRGRCSGCPHPKRYQGV